MYIDGELGISSIQVAIGSNATCFLENLDDELKSAGAKFDICDKITM